MTTDAAKANGSDPPPDPTPTGQGDDIANLSADELRERLTTERTAREQAENNLRRAQGRSRQAEVSIEAQADMEERLGRQQRELTLALLDEGDVEVRRQKIGEITAKADRARVNANAITRAQPQLQKILDDAGMGWDDEIFSDARAAWDDTDNPQPQNALTLARLAIAESKGGISEERVEEIVKARVGNQRLENAKGVDAKGPTGPGETPQPKTAAETRDLLRQHRGEDLPDGMTVKDMIGNLRTGRG